LGIEALDAEDADAGRALSRGLRKAVDARGLGGGEAVTLVELRLALGCETNDPACLAQGGPTLRSDQLVYGTLSRENGDLHIELALLDVESGSITKSVEQKLVPSDFLPGTVDATAERLLSQLFPEPEGEDESDALSPGIAETEPPPPPSAEIRDAGEPSDGLLAKPVPRWKWAGLGVGIGVTVTGVVMGAVTGVLLTGRLRDDVFDAAQDSVNDCIDPADMTRIVPCESASDVRNEANDVDPEMIGDLCVAGRSHTDALGNPLEGGAVRNSHVADACTRADRVQVASIVGFGLIGAGIVTSAVFTTLLFFPLRKNRKAAAFLRRQPRVGFTPTPGGGMMGGSIRF
jgi:hypothetical protein